MHLRPTSIHTFCPLFCFLFFLGATHEGNSQALGLGSTFAAPLSNPYVIPGEKLTQKEGTLYPDQVEEVYAGFGVVTTLTFPPNKKISKITKGSPIIEVSYDKASNNVSIFPTVTTGETNINITIEGVTYVFVVHIVDDARVQYRRTFSFPKSEVVEGRPPVVVRAKPIQPQKINTVSAIKQIERARLDQTYNEAVRHTMVQYPIGKMYAWNGCVVHLLEAYHFVNDDMIVLKVQWQNTTRNALYLHAQQMRITIANKEIPVTAWQQLTPQLLPGQMDTAYLFIQGYALSGDNEWNLVLPPDATSVKSLYKGR
jgi:hypothetical protein